VHWPFLTSDEKQFDASFRAPYTGSNAYVPRASSNVAARSKGNPSDLSYCT
ncbi:hypothetical protein MKX03_037502, partial [Papaver bracteatum]